MYQHQISAAGFERSRSEFPLSVPIACIALFIVTFVFSDWILEIYLAGDQQHYRAFWTAITWAPPSQWSTIQTRYLGSNDVLYSAIIALGVNLGIERIIYISTFNGLLSAAIGYLVLKHRASLIFSVLMLTNYYLLVLLTSAERLKFAYLFLSLALCINKTNVRVALSIFAAFCHSQSIVQFASTGIYFGASEYKKIIANRRRLIMIALFLPLALASAGYYLYINAGDVLSQKADFYSNRSEGFSEIIQWTMIMATGIIVFDKRWQFFLSMLPLGMLTYLYGNRINVATLALFCVLALAQRKTSHPLVLGVMAYMSFKSIGFIQNVIETGQGF